MQAFLTFTSKCEHILVMFIFAFIVAGKTEYVYVRVTEPARFAVEVYL